MVVTVIELELDPYVDQMLTTVYYILINKWWDNLIN